MSPFVAEHRPLAPEEPGLGTVAILGWDADVFGFPVAEFVPGPGSTPRDAARIGAYLRRFAAETGTELVSTATDPGESAARLLLLELGFLHVETSLTAVHPRLSQAVLVGRLELRAADSADRPALEAIAARAFRHGRYFGDPRFPAELAARRFVTWVGRAVAGADTAETVLVAGEPGNLLGFVHVRVEGGVADLRLAGVDPSRNGGLTGPALFSSAVRRVRELGARSARAKIAAEHTAILNVYAHLGFQFRSPRFTMHWHAPAAAHLRPPAGVERT